MTIKKTITIPDELEIYIKQNNKNLSHFVQDKLWFEMERHGVPLTKTNYQRIKTRKIISDPWQWSFLGGIDQRSTEFSKHQYYFMYQNVIYIEYHQIADYKWFVGITIDMEKKVIRTFECDKLDDNVLQQLTELSKEQYMEIINTYLK